MSASDSLIYMYQTKTRGWTSECTKTYIQTCSWASIFSSINCRQQMLSCSSYWGNNLWQKRKFLLSKPVALGKSPTLCARLPRALALTCGSLPTAFRTCVSPKLCVHASSQLWLGLSSTFIVEFVLPGFRSISGVFRIIWKLSTYIPERKWA